MMILINDIKGGASICNQYLKAGYYISDLLLVGNI